MNTERTAIVVGTIIAFLVPFFALYFFNSFVHWNLDPTTWSKWDRAVIGAAGLYVAYSFYNDRTKGEE